MESIIPPRAELKEAIRRQIRRELFARYEAEAKGAGLLVRLAMWLRIEREVAAEMKRRFPPGALYLGSASRCSCDSFRIARSNCTDRGVGGNGV